MASPVATVWAQFRLDMSDFASKLNTASGSLKNFAKIQQSTLKAQNQGYSSANAMIKSFNRSLNDTVNITRGILISQTFYAAAGAIQDAASALWDFNKQLDYAHVTYSALFGDVNLANDFMAVLQEHSIETIFDYQDLAGISKKLLAYGLEYENLMFIMEGLTNLGTMSGDAAALDRIALALGQIYTKGKLSAEEMRQLANAYVPITDIIKEKFNLSEDDLKSVGDLNLPAEEVINAIVDYANENFGSVGDAAMYTITGLQAKIVDTLKVVGAEMLKHVTTAYKSFLAYVANGLEVLREEFAKGGIGGVFEYLVPDEGTQKTIRIFLANIKNLFTAIMSLGKAAGQVFGNFAQVFAAVFNAVVPTITAITNALAILINAMASTSGGAAVLRVALVAVAGAFVLMRVQAMGALVITAVTSAVNGLSKALAVLATIIAKHPIFSLLAVLGVTLIGVSVASNSANNALSGLFDTLASAGGSSSGNMLQKTEEEIKSANSALDQFNNRLEEGKEGAEGLEDGMEGAADAAKKTGSVLSFDEVFKLKDPDSAAGAGADIGAGVLDDIENLIGGLDALGDALMPEIPDFSEFFNDFNDSLLGGLSENLMDKISAGGWGALIGGILGGLIGLAFGNPVLGAKIGTAVGAFVGVIFDELEYAISNTFTGMLAGIGAAISKAFGGAGLVQIIKTLVLGGSIDDVFKSIAGIFSATGAKALLKGGIIGAAVGLFVDGLAHLLWNSLEEKFTNANAETAKIGQTIGSLIGAIIGGILGGPAGAMIGSTIGTFVGGLIGLFWGPIAEYFNPETNALSAFFVETALRIGNWTVVSLGRLSAWWTDTYTGFTTWFKNTTTGFTNWWKNTTTGLSTWWTNTKSGFSTWFSDTFSGLSDWWSNTVATFSDWDSINSETLGRWWSETYTGFKTWFSDTFSDLTNWLTETNNGFDTWVRNTFSGLSTWWADTKAGYAAWFIETFAGWNKWRLDTLNELTWWKTGAVNAIRQWATDTWNSFVTWWTDTDKRINDWVKTTYAKITTWVTDSIAAYVKFKTDVLNVIAGLSKAAILAVGKWLSDMWTNMSTWFTEKTIAIKNKWAAMFNPATWKSGWSMVSSWFSSLFSSISSWFSNLAATVSSWWNSLFADKDVTVTANTTGGSGGGGGGLLGGLFGGHAAGGVFDREHVARFAEKNKAEAIIPLEEDRAMQPFVDAVANGLTGSLAPLIAQINTGNSNNLPPLYVGTLVADERGLRELYKKFEIIQVQENERRGLTSLHSLA